MNRVTILRIAMLMTSCLPPVLAQSEVTDTSRSHFAQVRAAGLKEVQWTGGFWGDRFAACRDQSVPAMWELMKGDQHKPFYEHFLIAAGDLPGEHHGAWSHPTYRPMSAFVILPYVLQMNSKSSVTLHLSVESPS